MAAGLATTFDVVDGERVCFHVPHPLDDDERLGAVELRRDALLTRFRGRFERQWERADPLDGHATDVENE